MSIKNKVFMFDATRYLAESNQSLYDFIWPTSVALWHFRAIINGYNEATCGNLEIFNNFKTPESLINRAALKSAFVDRDFDYLLNNFAQILLEKICSIYDGWCKDVLEKIDFSSETKKIQLIKLMYHPDKYQKLIPSITDRSYFIYKYIYKNIKNDKRNSLSNIKDLLVCFKYFKECRNCITHNNGIANDRLIDWQLKYNNIPWVASKEKPAIFVCGLGDKIELNLRGIVGFSDVVLKIASTLDAEYSCNKNCELLVAKQLKKQIQLHKKSGKIFPSGQQRRNELIHRLLNKCDFATIKEPILNTDLDDFLTEHSIML